MKIVYAAPIWGSDGEEGVIKKLSCQKRALENQGCEVSLITFRDLGRKCRKKKEDSIIDKVLYNYKAVKKLAEAIEMKKPDCIYTRDAMWLFGLYSKLSKIAPVFVEIQTNVLQETRLINKKRYWMEKAFKRSYLKDISGMACITGEILGIESEYNNKPSIILGNGVDKGQVGFIPRACENRFINLLFIGSPGMPWHGIDRLLNSYERAGNREKFILHIVGYENIYGLNDSNVNFYGVIRDEERINSIFANADIGIGTLALYYKKMNEAAPLKVRHYLAKGLPVVIGYDDIDLRGDLPFVMRVENSSGLIDFYSLEEFYNNTAEIRRRGDTVRFALEKLTWDIKMRNLYKFIYGIINSGGYGE